MEGRRAGIPGLVVERLGQVAVGKVRSQGGCARARRRRPARHRGCARQLREGAHDRLVARHRGFDELMWCIASLEFHYSPKHAFWPNTVEIKIRGLISPGSGTE